jgi:arabinose-5-phosphate isomerase
VVLIVEGPKLLGVITDGDLRRALQKREGFFQLKAAEVMTRNPVVTRPESRAQEALDLMENRPSQISVLPVVDPSGNWKGVVRLHDLIRAL